MGTVQIGRDPRLSGEALQAGLTAGLASQGVVVSQFDLATTPACFMSCIIGGDVRLLPHHGLKATATTKARPSVYHQPASGKS
jgi:hypothetical protein